MKGILLYWIFKLGTWHNKYYGDKDDYVWIEHRKKDKE